MIEGLRYDGVYIHVHNTSKEGYYTKGKDGLVTKHTYGFFEKLLDLIKDGEVRNVFYSYMIFLNYHNTLTLKQGAMDGELTTILKFLKEKRYSSSECHEIEDDELGMRIKGHDRSETFTLNYDGSILTYSYRNAATKQHESRNFTFMPWPNFRD